VFRKIGLNLPTHVMTQLSIAKSSIAQIFLYNLRASLILAGANTSLKPMPLYPDPIHRAITPYVDPYYDPYLYGTKPYGYRDEFDYYWSKRQTDRALKSARGLSLDRNLVATPKSFSHPSLRPRGSSVFPPLVNPYAYVPPQSRIGMTAAKMEIDDRNQQINEKQDEVQFLKGQLKRMEVLLQTKNYKIQELQIQIDKLKAPRSKLF
jgi:hypothetical protein